MWKLSRTKEQTKQKQTLRCVTTWGGMVVEKEEIGGGDYEV